MAGVFVPKGLKGVDLYTSLVHAICTNIERPLIILCQKGQMVLKCGEETWSEIPIDAPILTLRIQISHFMSCERFDLNFRLLLLQDVNSSPISICIQASPVYNGKVNVLFTQKGFLQ
ncbi:uncharacterized protein PHALS_04591 [Plasmopara halstedii]|uniref:Uncharacterized protein n=1 Tax=Plasmopara halstedii TaxID=4781 RepID=A0A0N7L3Y1_PLAHL|nr:uncharacterized protein PHALS_04591 [Plasmopara halstedii]CEG37139.1 hypothetical protein PHALS_04591 [Plasmopara halstedii]|eukprot:XP_024573508.1 hypothetical protein PHALS_04591 [Plasmopara halstedii]